MYCPKCGASAPDKQKFCRSCGTSLLFVSGLMAGQSVIDSFGRRPTRWGLSACAAGAATAAALKVLSAMGIYSSAETPYLIGAGILTAIVGAVVLTFSLLPHTRSTLQLPPLKATLQVKSTAATECRQVSDPAVTLQMSEGGEWADSEPAALKLRTHEEVAPPRGG